MIAYRTIATAAMLAVSATVGWFARGPAPTTPETPAPSAPRPAPAPIAASTTADPTPLIAVSSDGNVTLRVEQQPLEWVLEQIATQSGWADVKARARPAAAATSAAASSPPAEPPAANCPGPAGPPVDAARLLQAIERGGEADRFDALLRARSAGVLAPEQTLKSLYETDASERVRLAAFESYLEWRGGRDALREALEEALSVPSAAIQREATRRLEELREMERNEALSPPGVP